MMTDDVDELLRQAEVKFDQAILELAIEEGNRLLAAGAHGGRPAAADGAVRRGSATVARRRHGRGARARQAYQADRGAHALTEALIARTEACMAWLERHGATVH